MAETESAAEETPKKKSKLPLIIGIAAALVLGGGGFFAMYSGLIGGDGGHQTAAAGDHGTVQLSTNDIEFVPLEPLIISLGPGASNRHLRFMAQLEVAAGKSGDVNTLAPRVLDVLNGYLRAVDITDLEDPSALSRLRAQMLRRVQMVTGEGWVRDLLVTEFVLN